MAVTDNAFGIIIERSDDGTPTGTFAEAGEVLDANFGTLTRNKIEFVSHKSAGGYHTFSGGTKTPPQIQLDLAWDEASRPGWKSDFDAKAPGYYRITFPVLPTPVVWGFYGLIEELAEAVPINDVWQTNVTIQISGDPGR